MKKSVLIVAGIFLVIVAVILFSSPKEGDQIANDTTNKNPGNEHSVNPSDDPNASEDDSSDIEEKDESEASEEDEPEELPEVTPEDISSAVFESGEEAEERFLTKQQKKELDSASISKREEYKRQEQKYTLSWKSTVFDSQIPSLPEDAPVYLLERPEDGSIFTFLKQLSEHLQLKGAVIRMSSQVYAVADIATGDYFLTYDLYHLLFEAQNLNILLEEGEDPVTDSLMKWGLIGFPHTSEVKKDESGDEWHVYSPKLPLPVVSMKSKEVSSSFTPGEHGTVAVKSDGDYLTSIFSRFPNIIEKDTLPLANAEEISKTLESGEFQLGKMELQYPGALPLEDKREFYELTKRERISIESAELSRMECGYLLEDDSTVQALMSPICIAYGRGKVKQHSVFFQVALPAVAE